MSQSNYSEAELNEELSPGLTLREHLEITKQMNEMGIDDRGQKIITIGTSHWSSEDKEVLREHEIQTQPKDRRIT